MSDLCEPVACWQCGAVFLHYHVCTGPSKEPSEVKPRE